MVHPQCGVVIVCQSPVHNGIPVRTRGVVWIQCKSPAQGPDPFVVAEFPVRVELCKITIASRRIRVPGNDAFYHSNAFISLADPWQGLCQLTPEADILRIQFNGSPEKLDC